MPATTNNRMELQAAIAALTALTQPCAVEFHTDSIYLRDGIYAEVTLYYKAGKWTAFPWTYRDYQSEPYHRAFDTIRSLYRLQLKQR